ncbi:MAG: radical SAM protein [Thermoplasma acidophilum]|nr:radical SAM protein [Thermoplasma acidophilum]
MNVIEIEVKTALQNSGLKELDYSLNPYLGCMHRCLYCYAIDMTKDIRASGNWGSTIIVKKNIIDVLKREMPYRRRGIVGISTITDPYQPIEFRYRMTRQSMEILLREGFRVSIQTKSPLVVRDLDLISRYKAMVDVGMTITTASPGKARAIETQSPAPEARHRALAALSAAGIRTWIFFGPIIKGFNDSDEDIEGVVRIASDTGSRIIFDAYSFYPKSASLMIAGGIRPAAPDMNVVEPRIRKICEEYGVECNSEDEDYVKENARINRTLF